MSAESVATTQDETVRKLRASIARHRPVSPSLRKPGTSRWFNHADLIEKQLQEDGHRTWGYVIYRTTYDSGKEWAEFLRRLKWNLEDTFDGFNGRDILDLFTLTVIEDRQHLEAASSETVREHFLKWRETAPQLEQAPEGSVTGTVIMPGLSPRYRFAIQVDDASLRSVVHDAPAPPGYNLAKQGWVRLIDASWDAWADEEFDDLLEPIEGITEHDVGWMKIPYHCTDESYVRARDRNYWVTNYQRPPKVIGFPYDI